MEHFIFITREGDPLPIADRLKDEGKDVVVGIVEEEKEKGTPKDERRLALYDGIIDVHDAEDVMAWMKGTRNKDDYFVMFDYGDLWPWSERALKMGFTKGVFPTEETYKLEDDRQAGKKFAKDNYPGLKVAPVHEFKKVDDAIEFLNEQQGKIFVLKSEGSNAETVVPTAKDPDLCKQQLIGALRSEAKDYEKGGFTLEEKIQNPIELSPVMVTWNGKPLFTLIELENKPLGAGNIGRLTGGCQNLSILTPMDCPLNKIAFPPAVFEMAKKQPGIGIYDAGLLFDGKEFYFTEFCGTRWGWDGIFSELAMSEDRQHKNGVSRHFDLISEGKSPITWKFGASVRMFQTDVHSKDADCFQDGYQVDWDDKVSDQLFFYTIKKEQQEDDEEKPRFVSVGYRKDFGVGTGSADLPHEAIDRAYQAVEGVAMTGLYYRPRFDFRSKDYFASIENRFEFLVKSGLVGQI